MNGRSTTFSHRIRIALLFGLFLCLLILVEFRLYGLQCLSYDKYQKAASNIQIQRISLEPQRGWIFDRNGNPLATSVEFFALIASPKDIKLQKDLAERRKSSVKKELDIKLAEELAPILNRSKKTLLDHLTQDTTRAWRVLKKDITVEQAEQISQIRAKYRIRNELSLEPVAKRIYPKGELACHLLGPVGLGHPELISSGWGAHRALGGLEIKRQDYLSGTFGITSSLQDRQGNPLTPMDDQIFLAISGDQLYLTIDEMIQHIAETELDKAIDKFKAVSGMVVVMDPWTGDILAMANYPKFDPENYRKLNREQWRMRSVNRVVEVAFEPGSTFKIFPAAAAMEENRVSLTDTFDGNKGRIQFAGRTLRDTHPHEIMTFSEVIEVSSNIGIHQIAEQLGPKLTYDYIRKFGFGKPTGIELPGETPGLIQPLSNWTPLVFSRVSFGQSISVSAIQMAAALSAIANGGILMKPNIVKAVYNSQGGLIKEYKPEPVHRVLRPETAQIMSEIMEGVVLRGTGKSARLANYRVAGKTGTAQIHIEGGRGYKPGKYLASFIGFVPVESPRLVIGVFIEEPSEGGYYGGTVAAPVFRNIAEASLAQLRIHPKIPELNIITQSEKTIPVKEKITKKFLAEYRLTKAGLNQLDEDINNENEVIMDNLIGMTKREAMIYLADKKLEVVWQGSGVVVEQYPKPGMKITAGVQCQILLGSNSKLSLSQISQN